MSRNDKLIPVAIQAIKEKIQTGTNPIEGEFEGYVSSFASSVIQSGLIATLSFYTDGENKNKAQGGLNNTDGRRNIFLQTIMYMIDRNSNQRLLEYVLSSIYNQPNIYNNLEFNFATADVDQKLLNALEDEILQCAIALKLALRTFKLKK